MTTEHLYTNMGICHLLNESELCPDEILTILQTLDDNYNKNNIFNVAAVPPPGPLMVNKNSIISKKNKRNKPVKPPSSSAEDHAMLPKRKSVKRQVSSRATSIENGSGEDGNAVPHVSAERNRRKQMIEHLAVLRQLLPSVYVKKGDQASVVGGVIEYINELHQVLQSLKAKKQRKHYINEVGQNHRINDIPSLRLLAPDQLSDLSSLSPRTPRSTSPNKSGLIKHPLVQVQPSSITPLTSNSNSFSPSVADINIMMMNSYNNAYAISNDFVASSKSSVADVDVKFCGPNLELKTLSSKLAGQTMKIIAAIENLSLEILQVNVYTVKDTMFNAFTIKIGIECQLSAEELAQHIQQTFC